MVAITKPREAGTVDPERAQYERDIVLWADAQVVALKTRRVADLDFDHLAEEIEDVSGRARSELRSRTRTLVEHLLKLKHSRSDDPRLGWLETVERSRTEIEDLMADAPSLRSTLPSVLDAIAPSAVRHASRSLERVGEVPAATACMSAGMDFSVDQVFEDWMPEINRPE